MKKLNVPRYPNGMIVRNGDIITTRDINSAKMVIGIFSAEWKGLIRFGSWGVATRREWNEIHYSMFHEGGGCSMGSIGFNTSEENETVPFNYCPKSEVPSELWENINKEIETEILNGAPKNLKMLLTDRTIKRRKKKRLRWLKWMKSLLIKK